MAKATTKKVARNAGTVKNNRVKGKSGSARTSKPSPGNEIDARIIELADWRGETMAKVRILIKQVARNVTEEIKWRTPSNGMAGVPVWSSGGIICTGETYRNVVKLTFPKGAEIDDPARLFNASMEGGTRRAIDIHEEDELDERAFKTLVREAIALNGGKTRAKGANAKKTVAKGTSVKGTSAKGAGAKRAGATARKPKPASKPNPGPASKPARSRRGRAAPSAER